MRVGSAFYNDRILPAESAEWLRGVKCLVADDSHSLQNVFAQGGWQQVRSHSESYVQQF